MKSEKQVNQLDGIADAIGFIFYENSKRYVQRTPSVERASKVGVFVNASAEEIGNSIQEQSLDAVQLHGDESPKTCASLRGKSKIIKAFGVDPNFDFSKTKDYEKHVDYFLFDTRTKLHGGSGRQFDWSLLSNYEGSIPFFLSGGIDSESIKSLKTLSHAKLAGVDLNSGFEHSPGDKNISELKQFIKELKK